MFNLYKCFLLSFFISFSSANSDTIFIEEPAPTEDEKRFMKRYGYLEEIPDEGGAYTSQSLSEAVWKVQKFAGIPATGLIDAETRRLFKRRRCGLKDIQHTTNSKHRTRRYILQEGWNKKSITYRVLNGSRSLEKSRVESLMAAGLAVWAPHSGLRFIHVGEKADIQVSFASKDHGDGFPFDGPGHVVAHAFPPPHGAMHFDDDELWGESLSEENDDVTDFFAVAVHEIGHALGLSHSNVKESVMYPYYQVPVQKLHEDDIMGLHELYSKLSKKMPLYNVNTESSFAPPFTKADSYDYDENDIPDLCYTNYDTIQVIQGKIFVFEEEWMWVLNDRKKIADGYPKRFHDVFVGLPKHITVIRTIYEKQNGHIVVFHKRSFWEFNSQFRFIRRGKLTEYKLPRHVRELTTVFLSNYNNKTYLIEYERYWRLDESTDTMDRGYPKEMSAWRQVPYPVDAAIIWKEDTFFFRGPRFWRFDNNLVQAHEYYPLPTAQIWFPCAPTPDMTKYVTNDER